METPRFDRYQFDGKRESAVSTKTCIAFTDYQRMHIQRRSKAVPRRRDISWAFNDAEMKNVILTYLTRRYFIKADAGATDAERLVKINAAAAKQLSSRSDAVNVRIDAHRQATIDGTSEDRVKELALQTQTADGRLLFDRRPAALVTSIVWLSYRLGMDSTNVALELHILPPHVRQTLYKLNKIAFDLRTGRPYNVRKCRSVRPWSRQELVRLFFLRQRGLSYKECAKRLGRSLSREIYLRYFGRTFPVRKKRTWSRSALKRLFVLRRTGHTWKQCGNVLGLSMPGVVAAYRRHFGS